MEATGSCTVENGALLTARATAAGTCSVTLSQPGAPGWKPVQATRTYSVAKAQAKLDSIHDTFMFSGVIGCAQPDANPGAGCPTYDLGGTSAVPLSYALDPGADSRCRLQGAVFTLSNYTVLPVSCVVLVTGAETATHRGFTEAHTVVMNPFNIKLGVSITAASTGWSIAITTNFPGSVNVCDSTYPPEYFSYQGMTLTVTGEQVTTAPGGTCTVFVRSASGDGSATSACQQIELPAATVGKCTRFPR